MEVKINREIRDYTESMLFGLSMRQFFFALELILNMLILVGTVRATDWLVKEMMGT